MTGLVLFGGTAVSAQDLGEIETFKSKKGSVIWLKGEAGPAGALTLSIIPGALATQALRIYSEPSHTLLALVLDGDFVKLGDGEKWRVQKVDEEPRATAITKLPEAVARLTVEAAPKDDTRIAVHVRADWPNGKVEDRIVADALVGDLSKFEFSVSLGEERARASALPAAP